MSGALRRLALNNLGRNARKSSDYAIANFKKPTMDDLPVPSGSWQEHHSQMQAKYNRHLILGVGFFAVSLVVAKSSGLINMNWNPPPFPVKE
ncbi:uncharacterized protein LOC128992364 [Macrosteles quadrilineatus]|uniref:uncharacterized protein LOC128992364 n=1 Tax=Macrosteles quadrilineatus TaxID=74068 RepID=UPI0023E27D8E|nr:uncharacterized protein LOC128992364 [Macrosteles quadrilineatus]